MSCPSRSSRSLLLLVIATAVAVSVFAVSVFAGAGGAVAVTPDGATAGSEGPVAAAWQWITGQLGPATPATSASSIDFSQDYDASWTGPVTGSFVPRGVSAPVVDDAALEVTAPSAVPPDYAGTVSGDVTVTPQAGRWIVQAYRRTADGLAQVPLQALVAPDGTFSIDLGAAGDVPAGTWALGLLDADNGYAPTGQPWPDEVYEGWSVRQYVVTDTAYLVGEQPASADGSFAFADSRPGTKVVQLVDDRTGAVLAERAPDFGLVRSYAGGSTTYTYDQALAVLAAGAVGDPAAAARLTAGLLTLQLGDGGFVASADSRNPAAALPLVRTGITAVATYALLRRLAALAPDDPARPAVAAGAQAGVTWLLSQQRADGLIPGVTGDYRSDGSFDDAAAVGWVSTENDLDAWQALSLAGRVLGDDGASSAADRLATALLERLWDPTEGRFDEGLAADGTVDTTDPLDVSSWGSVFLQDVGRPELARQALDHTAAFASSAAGVSGFRAYYPQAAFPAAPANVWVEGSAGVVLAHQVGGSSDAAADLLTGLAGAQRPDGGFPYAMVADAVTGMTDDASVAAAAWFVLASTPGSIWS